MKGAENESNWFNLCAGEGIDLWATCDVYGGANASALRWPGFICSKAQDPLCASRSNKGVSARRFTVAWFEKTNKTKQALIYHTHSSLIKKKCHDIFFLLSSIFLKICTTLLSKICILTGKTITTYTQTREYNTKWREAWNGPVIVFFPFVFFFCKCAISCQQQQAKIAAWRFRPCTRNVCTLYR